VSAYSPGSRSGGSSGVRRVGSSGRPGSVDRAGPPGASGRHGWRYRYADDGVDAGRAPRVVWSPSVGTVDGSVRRVADPGWEPQSLPGPLCRDATMCYL
jgi:hypothetical protein